MNVCEEDDVSVMVAASVSMVSSAGVLASADAVKRMSARTDARGMIPILDRS